MSVLVDPVSQFKIGSTTNEYLRDVCLEHLTLIHKMSETILAKDRQIKVLKESNHQVNSNSKMHYSITLMFHLLKKISKKNFNN
jgi:hypothetical protein